MANFVNCPEEILVFIFRALSPPDLVNLAATCTRFEGVCCQKSLVRCLDFSNVHDYVLKADLLKNFLRPKDRYQHVEFLNLNHCYWLPATFFQYLKKMRNLKHLHLLDGRLTFETTLNLIIDMQLTSLSISFSYVTTKPDDVGELLNRHSKRLKKLTTLNAEISQVSDLSHLFKFLRRCQAIENLNVVKSCAFAHNSNGLYRSAISVSSRKLDKLSLPHLKSVEFPLLGFQSLDLLPVLSSLASLATDPTERIRDEPFRRFLPFAAPTPKDVMMEDVYILHDGFYALGCMLKEKFITLETICSMKKISLSKSDVSPDRPTRWRFMFGDDDFGLREDDLIDLGYLPGANHQQQNRDLLVKLFEGRRQMQCTTLALDYTTLPARILHRVATKCIALRSLSMRSCKLKDSAADTFSGLRDIAVNCRHITEWYLSNTWTSLTNEDPLLALSAASHLTRLSLPVEWFLQKDTPVSPPPGMLQGFNQKRCGIQILFSEDSMKLTRMWTLAEGCPLVKDLELIESPVRGFTDKVKSLEETLATISRFKYLERLYLVNIVNVVSGDFLRPILLKCRRLSYLHLVKVGMSGQCVYLVALGHSLIHATALRELRLEHPKLAMTAYLCNSLQRCPSLERLCLSTVVIDDESISVDLFRTLLMLSRLNVFFVWTQKETPLSRIKRFNASLSRIEFVRPLFKLIFENIETSIKDHRDSLYMHPSVRASQLKFCHGQYMDV